MDVSRPIDWAPVNPPVALNIVRASGNALTEGVETQTTGGVPVPITDPGKAVAGCFKNRNKIGIDALPDLMKRQPRRDRGRIYRYAQADRVPLVMRPYIEAMA